MLYVDCADGKISACCLVFVSGSAWQKNQQRYGRSSQNAKSVISLAKGKKQKECASSLNDPNHQNEIFRIAKQMVKESQDITGSNSERSIG